MTRPARDLPDHGTLSRHKHYGCNCQRCRDNYRAYENRRSRLIGYGTWRPLVDVRPVREHVAALVASGYTIQTVADAAGIDRTVVSRVLYYPHHTVRTEVADQLLAVQRDQLKPSGHHIIDGTGTRRRLQALVALGWPMTRVAPHLGIHARFLTDLTRADRVALATAQRVKDGYRKLCAMEPASHGVRANQITTARRMAAANGWHGPLAWDDIDNPDEQPDTDGVATPRALKKRTQPEEIAAEVRHLAGLGESVHFIAKQLGRSEKRITQLMPGYGEAA